MTTVGIIGSGMIGGTVARLSVAAGHQVVVSNSRGPETLQELVAELGPLATAGTAEQAAEAGDLVVVSVPVKAFADIAAKPLDGKPVLDTGNYYPQRDGQIEELDTGALTSSGLLQRDLPEAHVVKIFNNIYFKHLQSLARPSGAEDRTALPIAGDNAAAKAAVTAYLDSIGYDAVDAGPVAESWRQEPGTPAYGTPYGPFSDDAGTPASVAQIRTALGAAHRQLLADGAVDALADQVGVADVAGILLDHVGQHPAQRQYPAPPVLPLSRQVQAGRRGHELLRERHLFPPGPPGLVDHGRVGPRAVPVPVDVFG